MLVEILKPDFVFHDERGSLFQLASNEIGQVNYVLSEKGAVRGNCHYHKLNDESFFVISGEVVVSLSCDGIEESYTFHAGDMFLIRKGVRHTFRYVERTELIVFYDKGVVLEDGRKDIIDAST